MMNCRQGSAFRLLPTLSSSMFPQILPLLRGPSISSEIPRYWRPPPPFNSFSWEVNKKSLPNIAVVSDLSIHPQFVE
ncbi:unnamed protein product [Onchocerca flexuosa]|uniref:Secreted protein n=1 Tax=Onchocerca flexuosa TaxID=387005 RepID=A0A183I0B2_9BILA|nr:unnamed protein product [Onchocerca flexuosa]